MSHRCSVQVTVANSSDANRVSVGGWVSVAWPRIGVGSRADDCSGTWPVVPATAQPPHGAPGEELAREACKKWTSEGDVAG